MIFSKELTLCHKLCFSNPNIFGTQCRKPLIFQTYIFWSNKSHSLKFQRFTTVESEDIGIRKSEFVAKIQFLYYSMFLFCEGVWLFTIYFSLCTVYTCSRINNISYLKYRQLCNQGRIQGGGGGTFATPWQIQGGA